MSKALFTASLLAILMSSAATYAADVPMPVLTAVPFTDVHLDEGFWTPWVALTHDKILPHNIKYCESEGKIDNFRVTAKRLEGKHRGAVFEDSDVYKVIEGAAYCFAQKRDPEMEKVIDDIIDLIAAAQQPDGYINTYFTLVEPENRWTEDAKHETYCAGHMIEAAIAYYQATGKRTFLDVALKLAEHMWDTFGPGKQTDVSEHEEIELALVKLWRLTGDARHLELAKLFIERRGHKDGRKNPSTGGGWGEACQDHKPVREQTEIVGHAVRAMYLYSGVTDVVGLTGDAGYLNTLNSIWQDVTQRKMYVTGGIGDASLRNEGFSKPYFLPNDTSYCETCASIGMALWNQRMALLLADAKYADIVELEMFNGALGGVSMDGSGYFYCNRLACNDHRPPWQGCSCCPTNIVRFLPSIAGYMYAHDDRNIYINQYAANHVKIDMKGKTVSLKQETRYPWDGAVRILVEVADTVPFALRLRVPSWLQGPQSSEDLYTIEGKPETGAVKITVNGAAIAGIPIEKGYAVIDREWANGDSVAFDMPMEIRRVKANANVEADAGRIGIRLGPVVYCMEDVDNRRNVCGIAIPSDAPLSFEYKPDLLGGVSVVQGSCLVRYAGAPDAKPFTFTAVPFYSRDNRKPGYLQVWFPEDPANATPRPMPTIATEASPSTSFQNNDTAQAMNDLIEPKNSCDQNVPRLTWWDRLGTTEWAQYDFEAPATVEAVEVYWFDDSGVGRCRVPASWKLLYKDGNDWKPVDDAAHCGTKPDKFNRVEFKPVLTGALRIEVQLQPSYSGGILEWRVSEVKR